MLTIILFEAYVCAADTTLIFRKVKYSRVFDLAKQEKKAVMLYFHFDGCGACLTMEKSAFKDKNVASFYNTNFICLEVNTQKGVGIETNKIYQVQMHPSFLFLDEKGNILHKIVGVYSPEEFVRHAKDALDTNSMLAHYKREYNAGNRAPYFLYNYCRRLDEGFELDSLVITQYLQTQSLNELGKEDNIRFIYEFALYNYKITCPFNSVAFNYMLDHPEQFSLYFEREQMDTRLAWIINWTVSEAINKQDKAMFDKALESLKKFDTEKTYEFKEMDGRLTGVLIAGNMVLQAQMDYFEKAGDADKFNETYETFRKKTWNNWNALNNFAWYHYEQKTNKALLEKAVDCVKRSIELENGYANNDTYACLLYKLGSYDMALAQAEKAIALGKKAGADYGETETLLKKIKDKLKN